ncbi:cytidine deaminase [Anaeramoeba flamelloides]|uniref:cytidine deaminase n=1 Tax=Anaeramoeba flamelloides TaxID=1746091 RepID=A0ABQ8YMS5_9EUKA|nr:cytidine deaminase [Anaeramoeba flamelloides]
MTNSGVCSLLSTKLPKYSLSNLKTVYNIFQHQTLLKTSNHKEPINVETVAFRDPFSNDPLIQKIKNYEKVCSATFVSQHPNIQKCLGLILDKGKRQVEPESGDHPCPEHIIFLNESCPYSLNQLIQDQIAKEQRSNPIDVCETIDTILSGLQHLHGLGICHGNLNTNTIKFAGLDGSLKICSLENSQFINSQASVKDSFILDRYLAPEYIPRPNKILLPPSASSDCYSIGVLLYEMSEFKPYLENVPDLTAAIMVADKSYRPTVKKENPFKSLITSCWEQNPKNRPTLSQISSEVKTISQVVSSNLSKYTRKKQLPEKEPFQFEKEVVYSYEEYSNPRNQCVKGLNSKELLKLLDVCSDSMTHSYSPYSTFKVGASLLGTDDKYYGGANVENVSYGLTVCAERSAFFGAVSRGCREFKALAITSSNVKDFTYPCGACRQVIVEWGDFPVILYRLQDKAIKVTNGYNILPEAFTPKDLERDKIY